MTTLTILKLTLRNVQTLLLGESDFASSMRVTSQSAVWLKESEACMCAAALGGTHQTKARLVLQPPGWWHKKQTRMPFPLHGCLRDLLAGAASSGMKLF